MSTFFRFATRGKSVETSSFQMKAEIILGMPGIILGMMSGRKVR
jgi:hypothetical protein